MLGKSRFSLPKSIEDTKVWKAAPNWSSTGTCRDLRLKIKHFLRTEALFGRLDGFDEVENVAEFKVVVIGNKGTGKTSLIGNLCNVESTGHAPTHGITEHNAYWPIKLTRGQGPIVVHLRFWDAGVWCLTDERQKLEQRLKKQQAEKADAVLYVCTSTDYKSYVTIQKMIETNSAPVPLPPVRLVVMTRADEWVRRAVSTSDLAKIEEEYAVQTFGVSNIPDKPCHEKLDATKLLNALCAKLLQKDYEMRLQR